MKCPFCQQDNDKVSDTRTSDDGFVIRRRRTCCHCEKRFTTYERIETITIYVIKRNGVRVPYNREKIKEGLGRACWKRPVSEAQIATLIARVEDDIESMFETEVESSFIGQRVMQYLAEIDQVAYVRFASVYRHFEDASDFAQEIGEILKNPDREQSLASSIDKPKKPRFSKPGKKKQGHEEVP